MFIFKKGDLLASDAMAVVNTVNCVGVMGKGIALQFKNKYPHMFADYKRDCARGLYKPGHPELWYTGIDQPKVIINFPTKAHWKNPSKLEWILEGLAHLRKIIKEQSITSIAIPPLGCGNGGLNWDVIRPLIELTLCDITDCTIYIYEP